jgi:transposase
MPKWPPNSPDLNLIENVWGYVQARVDVLGCKSFEEFKEAVHKQFQAVSSSMLTNLFNSMKVRIACVVKKQGGKTGY